MKAARAVPAGLVDAGLASAASFAVGLFAARELSVTQLGTYSLFFTAFTLAAAVPAQLVLAPAQIASIAHEPPARLHLVAQTWRLAGPLAVLASTGAMAMSSLLAAADADVVLALAITTAGSALLSPLQDHVRASFHLASLSWRAAEVSSVHAGSVVVALLCIKATGVPAIWAPMSALAIGNALSLAYGFFRRPPRQFVPPLPCIPVSALVRSGRWLLGLEFALAASVFGAAVVVTRVAGPAALGHAEAARIVSQPLFVLTAGLMAVLGPRSMQAALAGDARRAHRLARSFTAFVVAAAAVYAVVVVPEWPGNPLVALVPLAYEVPHLVTLSVAAALVVALAFPFRSELLGAGRAQSLSSIVVLAAATQLAVSFTAGWAGALARPLALLAYGFVVTAGLGYRRRGLYSKRASPGSEAGTPVT